MNLKDTYDKIAEEWHRDHQQDDWWVEGTDMFASLLNKNDSVLDVGCGSGTKSKYLKQKGLVVTGIDFSEKMIEIAKREIPEGDFYVMDMQDVEEIDRTFNGIFIQAALLHIPKDKAPGVIQGLSSKLATGGYFYIAVKGKKPGRADEEIKTENDYGYPYERFFSYFDSEEIKKPMKESGLSIIYENITQTGNTNWIQVIGKKEKQ